MKKPLLVIAMFINAITSFAQTTPDIKTREDYLRKSRHQKTAAWILLGGGAVLIGTGFAVASASTANHALGDDNSSNTAGNVIAITGVLSSLGSIPLFVAASHNKRKAASLSLNMQRVPVPFQNKGMAVARQPAIAFTIAF